MTRAVPTTRTLGRDDWMTPPALVGAVGAVLPFALDAAASGAAAAKAPAWITPEEDALRTPWAGKLVGYQGAERLVWLNPPYGRGLPRWVARAEAQARDGQLFAVVLIPANTETAYWLKHVVFSPYCWAVVFLTPRVRFVLPGGGEVEVDDDEEDADADADAEAGPGKAKRKRGAGSPKGSALLIYAPTERPMSGPAHVYWHTAAPFAPVWAQVLAEVQRAAPSGGRPTP